MKIKKKYEYYCIVLDSKCVTVAVPKCDKRAFSHIIKSGSEAALKATLAEPTDDERKEIEHELTERNKWLIERRNKLLNLREQTIKVKNLKASLLRVITHPHC